MSDKKSIEIYESSEGERELAAFYDLLERTNKEEPDAEDLALLRTYLYGAPLLSSIAGDLAKRARNAIISGLTTSACRRESTEAYVTYIRNELGHDSAPMLEKLLIEQVVITWLRLYHIEIIFSRIQSSGPVKLDVGTYYDRRLSAAQRRFLRACTMLTRTRKMAGRTPGLMQLNIGAQQVNVAQVSED